MAWTEITRAKYQRDGLRYASGTAGAEWAVIEPHLAAPGGLRADAHDQAAGCRRCHFLHRPIGLPMAPVAQGFPAVHDGATVFLRVAGQRTVAVHQSCAADGRARGCWVVERTLAWLNRNRRLAKDVEATIESATAWLYIVPASNCCHAVWLRPERSLGTEIYGKSERWRCEIDSSQTLSGLGTGRRQRQTVCPLHQSGQFATGRWQRPQRIPKGPEISRLRRSIFQKRPPILPELRQAVRTPLGYRHFLAFANGQPKGAPRRTHTASGRALSCRHEWKHVEIRGKPR